ncbi:MAG: hypothetical protein USCGTAYLOR_02252 [Chromatiales bacterium USCg_Taylor]|nr:MAG: hypothetical protein USCGTAYLOR_02252 [Chromatiales bacterium USCg_Taylor]
MFQELTPLFLKELRITDTANVPAFGDTLITVKLAFDYLLVNKKGTGTGKTTPGGCPFASSGRRHDFAVFDRLGAPHGRRDDLHAIND